MKALDVRWIFFFVFGGAFGLVACSTAPTAPKMASATLKSRSGSTTEGHVHFHQLGENINVAYEVKGLAPKSKHGFHVHEKGDCSASDAASAGGHFNPGSHQHGDLTAAEHHDGDLGNITANEIGVAKGEITLPKMKIADLENRAVIVHEKADDGKTQPTGNSGARFACGVIE